VKELLEQVLEEDKLSIEVMKQYLSLYLGESEEYWQPHLEALYKRLRRNTSKENAAKVFRTTVCCAILIRAFYRSVPLDSEHPETLLFSCGKYHQFKERDWFDDFKKVIKRDLEIQKFRDQVLQLGVIDPIDYQPYCRQAYRWLLEQAEESGSIRPDNKATIEKSMRNIVYRYGGMVVSNVFTRNREVLSKVVNWNTGYFVERMLFNVYTPQQILKIKQDEITDTPPNLVKKIS
jgi:hypothetical protein